MLDLLYAIGEFFSFLYGYVNILPWVRKRPMMKNKSLRFTRNTAIILYLLSAVVIYLIIAPVVFYSKRILNL